MSFRGFGTKFNFCQDNVRQTKFQKLKFNFNQYRQPFPSDIVTNNFFKGCIFFRLRRIYLILYRLKLINNEEKTNNTNCLIQQELMPFS